MRFIDAPFYVRQMIVVSFIFTFVLAIIGLFASVRLCKKRRYIVLPAVTRAKKNLKIYWQPEVADYVLDNIENSVASKKADLAILSEQLKEFL